MVATLLLLTQVTRLFVGMSAGHPTDELKTWIGSSNHDLTVVPQGITLIEDSKSCFLEEGDPFGLETLRNLTALLDAFGDKGSLQFGDLDAKSRDMLGAFIGADQFDDPGSVPLTLNPERQIFLKSGTQTISIILPVGKESQEPVSRPLRKAKKDSKKPPATSKLAGGRSDIVLTFGYKGTPHKRTEALTAYFEKRNQAVDAATTALNSKYAAWAAKYGQMQLENGTSFQNLPRDVQEQILNKAKGDFRLYGFASEQDMSVFLNGAKLEHQSSMMALSSSYSDTDPQTGKQYHAGTVAHLGILGSH